MFEAMITSAWLAGRTEQPPGRIARPLRLVPASGRPGARGRLHRPCLRGPVRARDRLGFGRRRNADIRHRFTGAEGAAEPAAGIARDHHRAVGRRDARLRGRALHPARRAAAARPAREDPDRHRRGGQGNDAVGGRPRRLVERAHAHRRPARRDAAALGERPLFAAGAGGLRPALGPRATRSRRRRAGASAQSRWSAPPPSSSTTSARCRSGASNGSTSGSATLPRPRPWPPSATP